MPMSSFLSAITPAPDGTIEVHADWGQGRGIYGGVPAAAMVCAMRRALERPECALRSLTVHFCAPLMPGEARVEVESLRVGGRVAHMTASVIQGGAIATHATASFAAERPVELAWDETQMPEVPPAESLPSTPIELFGGPQFSKFFDYRFAGDPLPMTGSDSARLRTWIRPSDCPVIDELHAVGVLDAGAPAVLSRITTPRPMASVDFRMQLFSPLPFAGANPQEHWLLDAHARVVSEGYCEQITWLYTPEGRPVGNCQQLIAILG